MHYFRQAFAIITRYRIPYIILNAVFYGVVAAGMVYGALDRDTQQSLSTDLRQQAHVALPDVTTAYAASRILPSVALTFVLNFIAGSFLTIVLPSLVIPFSGLCLAAIRAVIWGIIFSPVAYSPPRFIAVLVLVILEGQGYILATLAAYIQGVTVLRPDPAQDSTWRQRYWTGLKRSLPIHLLIAAQLAIAAIYEALLIIVLLSSI